MKLLILSIFLIIVKISVAEVKRFDNYNVWRITPQSKNDLITLQALHDDVNYDVWNEANKINENVDIMVPPNLEKSFLSFIKKNALKAKIYIKDVQKAINKVKPKISTKSKINDDIDFNKYNTYEEITNWMEQLPNKYKEVSLVQGGQSYEGRRILGVHISYDRKNKNQSVFLEGGIHAREWIAVATTIFQLNAILTSTDPAVRKMAESHDWYIFPIFNPDGYVYTFTHNRMWRKSRKPYGKCVGADLNRNWGYKWGLKGASTNSCLDNFAGGHVFSEIETKTLSQYIDTIAHNLIAYIGHHSYSQVLLIPYGESNKHQDNYDQLMEIGRRAVKSLAKRYGTKFEVGNVADLIYPATGSSVDWVKATYNITLTYTYELRDTGKYGFLLPPEEIIPSGLEIVDALVVLLQK